MIWEFQRLARYLGALAMDETATFGYPRERSF